MNIIVITTTQEYPLTVNPNTPLKQQLDIYFSAQRYVYLFDCGKISIHVLA